MLAWAPPAPARAPTPPKGEASRAVRVLAGAPGFTVHESRLYAAIGKALHVYDPATGKARALATGKTALRQFAVADDGKRLILHFEPARGKPDVVEYRTLAPARVKTIPLDGQDVSELHVSADGHRALLIGPRRGDPWHFRVLEAELTDVKPQWRPMFEGRGVLYATRAAGLIYGEPATQGAEGGEPPVDKVVAVDFRMGKSQVVHTFKSPPEGRRVQVLDDRGAGTLLLLTDGAAVAQVGLVDWAKGEARTKALPRDNAPFSPAHAPGAYWFVSEAPAASRLTRWESEGEGRFVPDGAIATPLLRRARMADGMISPTVFWKRLDGALLLFDAAGHAQETPLAPAGKAAAPWEWVGSGAFVAEPPSFFFGAMQDGKPFVLRVPLPPWPRP